MSFFYCHMEKAEQCSELFNGLKFVFLHNVLDHIRYLVLDVSFMVIDNSEWQSFPPSHLLGCRQMVFSLQFPANRGRALPLLIIIDFLSLPVNTQGDDMDMGPADILMQVDDIGWSPYPIFSMYSCPMAANCSSVSISSGCGLSETWITGFSVRRLAARYGSKERMQCWRVGLAVRRFHNPVHASGRACCLSTFS